MGRVSLPANRIPGEERFFSAEPKLAAVRAVTRAVFTSAYRNAYQGRYKDLAPRSCSYGAGSGQTLGS
jgi:hypothetical protein